MDKYENFVFTEANLDKFGIHDLRTILRDFGGTPALKKKDQIIKEILEIRSGKVAVRSGRGRKAVKKVEEALGENGRILLRESGTEPVIRVMVEAETDEICREMVDSVVKVIEEKGNSQYSLFGVCIERRKDGGSCMAPGRYHVRDRRKRRRIRDGG